MIRPYRLDDDGHAIDRFIERHLGLPGMRSDRAYAERTLSAICKSCSFVEALEDEGQEIWRGQSEWAHVLLVVKDGVVRTVLPRGATRPRRRR